MDPALVRLGWSLVLRIREGSHAANGYGGPTRGTGLGMQRRCTWRWLGGWRRPARRGGNRPGSLGADLGSSLGEVAEQLRSRPLSEQGFSAWTHPE